MLILFLCIKLGIIQTWDWWWWSRFPMNLWFQKLGHDNYFNYIRSPWSFHGAPINIWDLYFQQLWIYQIWESMDVFISFEDFYKFVLSLNDPLVLWMADNTVILKLVHGVSTWKNILIWCKILCVALCVIHWLVLKSQIFYSRYLIFPDCMSLYAWGLKGA